MADASILHEIAEALRTLQAKASDAGSPTARALLGMTAAAIVEMAGKVEGDEPPPARTVSEMLRRLRR